MLGVSIVLYHSPLAELLVTLEALSQQTLTPDAVVVHLNAGSADERTRLASALASAAPGLDVALTWSSENRGFAGAHNRSLASLFDRGCHAAVVLNPDLALEPTALEYLDAARVQRAAPALFGPLLELADPVTLDGCGRIDTAGITWIFGARHVDTMQGRPMGEAPSSDRPIAVAGISGACILVPRVAHDRIVSATGEFFDEDFIAYREDAELGLRATVLGVSSYLVPSARGRHGRALRGTERGRDSAIDRLGVRNRFLIAFKYGFQRPGGFWRGLLRDVVVVVGVLVRERSSAPGLIEAWHLRHRMREKAARLRGATASRQ